MNVCRTNSLLPLLLWFSMMEELKSHQTTLTPFWSLQITQLPLTGLLCFLDFLVLTLRLWFSLLVLEPLHQAVPELAQLLQMVINYGTCVLITLPLPPFLPSPHSFISSLHSRCCTRQGREAQGWGRRCSWWWCQHFRRFVFVTLRTFLMLCRIQTFCTAV